MLANAIMITASTQNTCTKLQACFGVDGSALGLNHGCQQGDTWWKIIENNIKEPIEQKLQQQARFSLQGVINEIDSAAKPQESLLSITLPPPCCKITLLGNSYQRIATTSHVMCSISSPAISDSSIKLQRGPLYGNNTKTVDWLSVPANQVPYCKDSFDQWINDSDVVITIVESFDAREESFNHIVKALKQLKDTKKLCFMFSRDIVTVHLRGLLLQVHRLFGDFWYLTGVVWGSNSAHKMMQEMIENVGSWDSITALKHSSSNQIMSSAANNPRAPSGNSGFGSLSGSNPQASLSLSLSDTPVLLSYHRKRAREFMVKALKETKADATEEEIKKTATETEDQVYGSTMGTLQDYISTLCHQRISLQVEQTDIALSKTGKRIRCIDGILDKPKKLCTSKPSYQWYYPRTQCEFNTMFGISEAELEEPFLEVPADINEMFEARYRDDNQKGISVDVVLPDMPPVKVNLQRREIFNAKNELIGKLERKTFYQGDEIEVAGHWRDYQDENMVKLKLEPSNKHYQQIIEEVHQDVPGVSVSQVWQLQNLEQYRHFETEQYNIAVNNSEESREIWRYFGSNYIKPDVIVDSVSGIPCSITDPDPNQNWGAGIHVASEPWYADERAYEYKDDSGCLHKQILVVQVSPGKSTEIPFDTTLKRPPERCRMNHMPIYYDSISNKYEKNNRTANVTVVYKSSQVLPAFLVDYKVANSAPYSDQ